MSVPTVSVIIPVYNAEQYLVQCLDSVLGQTLEDIEVICVDDGSTDGSGDILALRAEQDSRVRIKHQDNAGPGPARNCALSMARGQYVAFMDADDLYPESDTLEQLYQGATAHGAKIAGGYRMILRDAEAQNEEYDPLYKLSKSIPDGGIVSYEQIQTDFNYQCYIYELDFLVKENIFFPDYRRFQDPPFFVRAMCDAQSFYLLPKLTYLYRWGHQNIQWTARKAADMLRGNIDVLLLAKEYKLPRLYSSCVKRLSSRYKEILLTQLSLTETEIYLLSVYANTISDPSRLDDIENNERSSQLARLLKDCEAHLRQLLSVQYQRGEDYLCDFLSDLYSRFLAQAPDLEQEIVSSLLCILSGMFAPNFCYQVRVLLHKLISGSGFQSLGWLDHADEWYTDAGLEAVQVLNSIDPAFAFADNLGSHSQEKECTLIHDCVVPDAKFSVLIPVYNVAPFLAECLDSVLQQTLPGIEIICIDDGSTDESLSILMDYAQRFPNIKLLKQKNAGLSAARNRCMEVATGEYIQFLDSDDWMMPESYQTLYQRMKSENLDLLFFNGKSFYDDEQLREKYGWYETAYSRECICDSVLSGPDYYTHSFLNKTFYTQACMFAVRRQFLEDSKISFLEGILHEDNLFTNVCTLSASRVSHITEPFYCRRVREGSLTIRPKEFRHSYGYFACFLNFLGFVSCANLDENALSVANMRLKSIISNARTEYEAIQEESQKRYYLALPDTVSMLFYQIIVESIEKRESLENRLQSANAKKSELNQKFRAEKAELNQKLRTAWDEKRDRGVQIRRLTRKNNELQSKLKITYDEKYDRGVQIRELEKQQRELKKELSVSKNQLSTLKTENAALKKKNKAMKQSTIWKVGRVVTWPGRKLKRLLKKLRKK